MGLIRFILACFVVMYHCGQFEGFKIMQGPEAVQTFYIISGFYMSLILHEKYWHQPNAYRLFISNRLLKLLPAYWLTILVTVILSFSVALFTGGGNWSFLNNYHQYGNSLNPFAIIFFICSNLFIVGQDLALFLGLNSHTGQLFFTDAFARSKPAVYSFMLVPQAWTISIEILFYLIAPFFVRKKTGIIILLAIAAFLIKFFLYKNGFNYDPWSYRFFPAEMLFFLLGVLSYKLYASTKNISIPFWTQPLAFLIMLLVILSYSYLHFYIRNYFYFVGMAVGIPLVFRYTKNNVWDRKIGEYSYPIYIVHVLVKTVVFIFIGAASNVSIPVIIGSIILAYLFNRFINKKIELYRQRRITNSNLIQQ